MTEARMQGVVTQTRIFAILALLGCSPNLLDGTKSGELSFSLEASSALIDNKVYVEIDKTFQFTATGVIGGAQYSVTSGEGTIDSSGLYTAPSAAGEATIRITDSSSSVDISLVIYPTLVMTSSASILKNGQSTTVTPTDGVAPYTYSVASGPGTVDSTGLYTAGKPTAELTHNAVVRVTDAVGNTSDVTIVSGCNYGNTWTDPLNGSYIGNGDTHIYFATSVARSPVDNKIYVVNKKFLSDFSKSWLNVHVIDSSGTVSLDLEWSYDGLGTSFMWDLLAAKFTSDGTLYVAGSFTAADTGKYLFIHKRDSSGNWDLVDSTSHSRALTDGKLGSYAGFLSATDMHLDESTNTLWIPGRGAAFDDRNNPTVGTCKDSSTCDSWTLTKYDITTGELKVVTRYHYKAYNGQGTTTGQNVNNYHGITVDSTGTVWMAGGAEDSADLYHSILIKGTEAGGFSEVIDYRVSGGVDIFDRFYDIVFDSGGNFWLAADTTPLPTSGTNLYNRENWRILKGHRDTPGTYTVLDSSYVLSAGKAAYVNELVVLPWDDIFAGGGALDASDESKAIVRKKTGTTDTFQTTLTLDITSGANFRDGVEELYVDPNYNIIAIIDAGNVSTFTSGNPYLRQLACE